MACPVTAFPYDNMFLIDGVWRIVQGQREGVDFYNPIGFGLFHLAAAWWQMIGPRHDVLAVTIATYSVVITVCASLVCARQLRRSGGYCLLICSIIALECSAPSAYGYSFFTLGISACYNRLTTGALAVLFLQWFAKSPFPEKPKNLSDAIISAILLNILLLLKISALGIGLFIIIASLLVEPQPLRRSRATLGYLGLMFLVMAVAECWAAGVDVPAIVRVYREAAAVRSSLAASDAIWRVLDSKAAIACVVLFFVYARKPPAISLRSSAVAIVGYAVAQLGLNVSNTQPGTLYLAPACAVVLLAWRQRIVIAIGQHERAPAERWTKSPIVAMPLDHMSA